MTYINRRLEFNCCYCMYLDHAFLISYTGAVPGIRFGVALRALYTSPLPYELTHAVQINY